MSICHLPIIYFLLSLSIFIYSSIYYLPIVYYLTIIYHLPIIFLSRHYLSIKHVWCSWILFTIKMVLENILSRKYFLCLSLQFSVIQLLIDQSTVSWFKVQSHLSSFYSSDIFGEESKNFCPTCSAFTVFLCFTSAVSFNFTSCEWAGGWGLKEVHSFPSLWHHCAARYKKDTK